MSKKTPFPEMRKGEEGHMSNAQQRIPLVKAAMPLLAASLVARPVQLVVTPRFRGATNSLRFARKSVKSIEQWGNELAPSCTLECKKWATVICQS
jgi:hypothetical protein